MQTRGGTAAFSSAVERLASRPAFAHSRIGVQLRDVQTGTILYDRLGSQLFAGASTAKLLTCANALAALGPDYRFETRVFRTGELDEKGVLHGDLVLVAAGDPNLSGRVEEDDTLRFCDVDHALAGYYDGIETVPGDTRKVFRGLASQIASYNIRRVRGSVLVDASLFPEGEAEAGTQAVISPVSINDNLIDIEVRGSPAAGEPAAISFAPPTRSVRILNDVKTVGSRQKLRGVEVTDEAIAEGVRVLTVRGEVEAGERVLTAYRIPEPSAFARALLQEALEESGITFGDAPFARNAPRTLVATHRSPPLREAVKVVLKVSQNLHAEMLLRLVLSRGGPPFASTQAAGAFLGDGCGAKAHFTPNFMCEFLTAVWRAPWREALVHALPVLGHDGTLHDIQRETEAAAAKAIRAKTGTLSYTSVLSKAALMESKALAGFVTTSEGRVLAFAAFFSDVPIEDERNPGALGNMVASLAVAAYDHF